MISINGRILENVYTTAQWAAITEPLPDRVFGYEVDGSGLPVGKKMGNGIALWGDLPYWYVGATPSNTVEKTITSGTSGPYLLSAPQLAIVNSLGRIPNFVALVGIYMLSAQAYRQFQ